MKIRRSIAFSTLVTTALLLGATGADAANGGPAGGHGDAGGGGGGNSNGGGFGRGYAGSQGPDAGRNAGGYGGYAGGGKGANGNGVGGGYAGGGNGAAGNRSGGYAGTGSGAVGGGNAGGVTAGGGSAGGGSANSSVGSRSTGTGSNAGGGSGTSNAGPGNSANGSSAGGGGSTSGGSTGNGGARSNGSAGSGSVGGGAAAGAGNVGGSVGRGNGASSSASGSGSTGGGSTGGGSTSTGNAGNRGAAGGGGAAGPATAASPAAASASEAHIGSRPEASPSPAFLDGVYQGSGVLVASSRPCSARDVAHIRMQRSQVSFEGVSTGAVDGSSGSGSQMRVVDFRAGPVRLVGNFGEGTFVGSLSNAGCVYDYTLQKIEKRQQLATLTPPVAPGSLLLGSPSPSPQAVQGAYSADRRDEATPERRSTSRAVKKPQRDMVAERQARRGEQMLREGKIVEARRLFEPAALAGSARGALGLGMTYDPSFLSSISAREAVADALVAKIWYRRAQLFGDKEARSRLAKLDAWNPG